MELDFTFKKLKKLYSVILEQNYKIITFADFFKNNNKKKIVILRHDVDRKPENSLKIASLEHDMGINSSFYFRFKKGIFIEEIIRKISGMGHEIGYHYEVLSKTKGDMINGIKLFKDELSKFNKIINIKTICMHGSPLSKWDSRKLWDKLDYKEYGLIGEPYFDIDFNKTAYITDTGRRWNAKKMNVRDKVNSGFHFDFKTTDDVINAFKGNNLPDKVMINIHPHRWYDKFSPWLKELVWQNLKNIIKRELLKRLGARGER